LIDWFFETLNYVKEGTEPQAKELIAVRYRVYLQEICPENQAIRIFKMTFLSITDLVHYSPRWYAADS
jgi:hypothetical protein